MNRNSILEVVSFLREQKFIDLTHAFQRGIPHAEDFDDEVRTTLFHHDDGVGTLGSGFLAHRYSLVGQWGTHADPPAHFIKGGRFLDEINVKEMVLPLVVFDITDEVKKNNDYQIQMKDVKNWENKYGSIPDNSFALLKSGWHKKWPNEKQMLNRDDNNIAHFPGWSIDVMKYLIEECNITACGHETTDTDRGIDISNDNYPIETYVLKMNRYQIELIANTDELVEYGGMVISTFPKPFKGSGFPARVFAIIPNLKK